MGRREGVTSTKKYYNEFAKGLDRKALGLIPVQKLFDLSKFRINSANFHDERARKIYEKARAEINENKKKLKKRGGRNVKTGRD